MKFCLPSNKINYDWVNLCRAYKKYVTRRSVVLEVGASNIERTKELAKYCYKLIGVEIDPTRKPVDFENITYQLGDWQNLSEILPPESIDIAISE